MRGPAWFAVPGRSGDRMGGTRRARLNEQFKREITEILRREVRDPRVGAPTLTAVDVTPDLWLARVYVRPDLTRDLADPETTEALMAGLEASTPFIRRSLGRKLSLRRIPELRFQLDRSVEHAARIDALLREIEPELRAAEAEGSDSGELQEDRGAEDA
jgi:ribosome-binding factor A